MTTLASDPNLYLEREWFLGDWYVQPQLNTLERGHHRMRITPKATAVLAVLAHANGVVSREQLIAEVWREEHITDDVLTHAISTLRKALGDSPRASIYIQTIPKKGYRLLMPPSFEAPDIPKKGYRLHMPPSFEAPDIPKKGYRLHVPPSFEAPDGPQAANEINPRMPHLADNHQESDIPASQTPRRARLWWGLSLCLLAALLFGLGWWRMKQSRIQPESLVSQIALPLTTMPGSEEMPDFSPDGQKIAFSHQGNIWIKIIQSADVLQITDGPETDYFPRWHPNGREIVFARYSMHDVHILAVPSVGGATRELTRCRANSYATLAIHPTGRWLAYSATESPLGGQTLFLLNLETLETFGLTHLPERQHYSGDSYPSFSPSGRHLAFARSRLGSRAIFLQELPAWILEPDGAAEHAGSQHSSWPEPRQLLGFDQDIYGITWHRDGMHLIYAGGFPTHTQLMALKLEANTLAPGATPSSPGGTNFAEPLAIAVTSANPIAPTMGATGLAFVDKRLEQNIWEYRIKEKEPLEGVPFLASTRQDFNPRFSPKGDTIAFASARSGSTQIWVCDSDGQQLRQLTHMQGPFAVLPVWSPDGRRISFTANTHEQLDIYSVTVATGQVTPLVTDPSQEASSWWSPDGRWLYFTSDREGNFSIWKMPSSGGEAHRVQVNAFVPRLSADGDWLYFVHFQKGGIWRKHLVQNAVERLVGDLALKDWNHWDLTAKGIYYINRHPSEEVRILFRDHLTGAVEDVGSIKGALDYEVAGLSVRERLGQTRILIPQIDVDESDILMIVDFEIRK